MTLENRPTGEYQYLRQIKKRDEEKLT